MQYKREFYQQGKENLYLGADLFEGVLVLDFSFDVGSEFLEGLIRRETSERFTLTVSVKRTILSLMLTLGYGEV